jgi:hypothetical protein
MSYAVASETIKRGEERRRGSHARWDRPKWFPWARHVTAFWTCPGRNKSCGASGSDRRPAKMVPAVLSRGDHHRSRATPSTAPGAAFDRGPDKAPRPCPVVGTGRRQTGSAGARSPAEIPALMSREITVRKAANFHGHRHGCPWPLCGPGIFVQAQKRRDAPPAEHPM